MNYTEILNTGAPAALIPLAVILLAAFTKKIVPALITGILLGGLLFTRGNIIEASLYAANKLSGALKAGDGVYIVFFLYLFGALSDIIKVSGGIKGFTLLASRVVKTEKGALGAVWAMTPFTFIDCCFHGISAGMVGKSLNDKVNGNKKKLAFVLNITSCLLIILIPFGTTYIGYIMGVISSAFAKAGMDIPAYDAYLKSIPFNFFPIIMVLISIFAVVFNFGFKKDYLPKTAHDDGIFEKEHGHDEAHEKCTFEENAPPRAVNLIIPLSVLIFTTVFFLYYTGRANTGQSGFFTSLISADFERAIFASGLITLVLTSAFYLFQKIPLREIESHFFSGGNEMLTPIVVLILSWGLSGIISDLGFEKFVSSVVASKLPAFLIPVTIYLIGSATSYFIGTAWGTWALLMPLAIPLAAGAGISVPLVIGAVLSGGALGDHASPLGETGILSASIAGVPLYSHIRSQLPYSLLGLGVSAVLFVVFPLFL